MEFNKITDLKLISVLQDLVKKEKGLTLQILCHLREVESRKLYVERGHSSLFKFCLMELKYSEAEAQTRIQAMRLLRDLPQVDKKIETGAVSLTNASKVQNQFRKENQRRRQIGLPLLEAHEKLQILDDIDHASTRQCERRLAQAFPEIQGSFVEYARPIANERTLIQFSADPSLLEKFEKLKGLLGHKIYEGSWEGLFSELAEIGLKKLDYEKNRFRPLEASDPSTPQNGSQSAEPNQERKVAKLDAPPPGAPQVDFVKSKDLGANRVHLKFATNESKSRYIPLHIRRMIWKNSNGKCQYRDPRTGQACSSQHALEIDHILPISAGGKHEIGNLRLLCDIHNRWRSDITGLDSKGSQRKNTT